jgi:hypothetical protein
MRQFATMAWAAGVPHGGRLGRRLLAGTLVAASACHAVAISAAPPAARPILARPFWSHPWPATGSWFCHPVRGGCADAMSLRLVLDRQRRLERLSEADEARFGATGTWLGPPVPYRPPPTAADQIQPEYRERSLLRPEFRETGLPAP